MAKGRFGVKRPFVKTRLKYDVYVEVPEEIWYNPPKATELLDMRVSAVQSNSNEVIKKFIGKIILAVNNLTYPNRAKIVSETVDTHESDINVPHGIVKAEITYAIEGTGMGEAAETRTYASSMRDLYEVLVNENEDPIAGSSSQQEWSPDPYNVTLVAISTN